MNLSIFLHLALTPISRGFRLDRYRGDPKEKHSDCFDFESHIYVDDAFMLDKDSGKKFINSYVEDLIKMVSWGS